LAATKERNHLARELHDSVTQTIFSITLTAKSARMLLDKDPGQVVPQLDHLQELAQGALAEMRGLIFELRPPAVEEIGLVPALRKHFAALKSRNGLTVEFRVAEAVQLSGEQERRLFRIIQEALNNIVKYAQTDRAAVTLTMEQGQVLLLVEDEGIGFDPAAVEAGQEKMGLTSMRERAEMMGGTFEIDSHPEVGTRIRVAIPQAEGEKPDG
jgi:signal transduction histidine kinase